MLTYEMVGLWFEMDTFPVLGCAQIGTTSSPIFSSQLTTLRRILLSVDEKLRPLRQKTLC